LFRRLKAKDSIHVLLHGLIVDHLLPEKPVLLVLLLFLGQQRGVLLGELRHLRDGLSAQGVKGSFCRLMPGNLVPMLRQKFLLVTGLLVGGVDLPRFGVIDDMGFKLGNLRYDQKAEKTNGGELLSSYMCAGNRRPGI